MAFVKSAGAGAGAKGYEKVKCMILLLLSINAEKRRLLKQTIQGYTNDVQQSILLFKNLE